MRRMLYEQKICGIQTITIFAALTLAFALLASFGGELLNLGVMGFEVVYPFMTAIAAGEWGKTRADANFDLVAAQSKSLFQWVAVRYWTVFITGSLFALVGMMIVCLIRREMALWEMALLYFPPAFLLSTLSALSGILFSGEHIATLVSGVVWLISMLARSLLRIPGVEYVYLFIRYAGDVNGVWLMNKTVLTLMGLGLWVIIYLFCRKRIFME